MQLGLLEVGPRCGIAEAVLALGVHVVSLSINAHSVAPQVVLVVDNCPAPRLTSGKVAKFGVWNDEGKGPRREPLKEGRR